ncbi:hypothetical protein QBC34DRAFT_440296 [Podospora aff. communis PSN243]|uniref:Uncharacterized protein n=1 Tax=Podospora aff. communis PSN243 TaxID=3040156 RepID=A0AAV9GEZ3_9PEZI|nr:hypothetical protein QBC34DRAFT_440296 [Podospora aff. communis PSN243]
MAVLSTMNNKHDMATIREEPWLDLPECKAMLKKMFGRRASLYLLLLVLPDHVQGALDLERKADWRQLIRLYDLAVSNCNQVAISLYEELVSLYEPAFQETVDAAACEWKWSPTVGDIEERMNAHLAVYFLGWLVKTSINPAIPESDLDAKRAVMKLARKVLAPTGQPSLRGNLPTMRTDECPVARRLHVYKKRCQRKRRRANLPDRNMMEE